MADITWLAILAALFLITEAGVDDFLAEATPEDKLALSPGSMSSNSTLLSTGRPRCAQIVLSERAQTRS